MAASTPGPIPDEPSRTAPATRPDTSDALAALLRWEAAGGTWVVADTRGGSAAVDLITCDGGEVVGHLNSASREFVAYVSHGRSQ